MKFGLQQLELDFFKKLLEKCRLMGRGRKSKIQKMKNKKRQAAFKTRLRKKKEAAQHSTHTR